MNIYENVVILNPTLSDEELKTATDKITDLITSSGGEILKVDVWGRKRLAYELNKQKMGYYVLLLFKAPTSTLKKLEGYFQVFDPVIKSMPIKLGKKEIAALPKEIMGAPAPAQEGAETKEA